MMVAAAALVVRCGAWRLRGVSQHGSHSKFGLEKLLFVRQQDAANSNQTHAYEISQNLDAFINFDLARRHKNAYWGKLTVGNPRQEIQVIFDTGSGNIIIPGLSCIDEGCEKHNKYDASKSMMSLVARNEDGERTEHIRFGTGEISGDLRHDTVCIGGLMCVGASFVAAVHESKDPFQMMPFDGIVGLAWDELSFGDDFNILQQLTGSNMLPRGIFSFYLTDDEGSEVVFGGFKPEHMASEIFWVPVKEKYYWQISIDDVILNKKRAQLCKNRCQVAVDTGTSSMAFPSGMVAELLQMLSAQDCANLSSMPHLGFQIGDTVLNLRPEDYLISNGTTCQLDVMSVDIPLPQGQLLIFGQPFLRRFVSVFDRSEARIGFAVAKNSDNRSVSEFMVREGGRIGQPPTQGLDPNAVVLPLQSGWMTGGFATTTPAPPPPPPKKKKVRQAHHRTAEEKAEDAADEITLKARALPPAKNSEETLQNLESVLGF